MITLHWELAAPPLALQWLVPATGAQSLPQAQALQQLAVIIGPPGPPGAQGERGATGGVSEAQATAIAESAATITRFNPLALVEAMLNPGL